MRGSRICWRRHPGRSRRPPEPREFVAQGDRVFVAGFAQGNDQGHEQDVRGRLDLRHHGPRRPSDPHPGIHRHASAGPGLADGRVQTGVAPADCPTLKEIPMYDPSKQSELIRFARVEAGSTVIDVYPGDGDWTRLFSDVVGPEGRVYSFVPAEVAHFKNDPVGLMRTLAKEPGRENVEAVSADLVAMPEATRARRRPVAAPVLPRSPHRADPGQGRDGGRLQSSRLRAAEARRVLRHRRSRRRRRVGHGQYPVAASDRPWLRPRRGGGSRLRAGRAKHHAREPGRSALDQGVRSVDQGRDRSLRLSVREALTSLGPTNSRLITNHAA